MCGLRTLFALIAALALVFGAGCASDGDSIGATFDPLTEFPATATWKWDETANRIPDDDRIDAEQLDVRVRQSVAAEFAARGYTETAASPPTYLLSYDVGVNTWISRTEARAIGTLSVLMRDATNDRRVWLGFVRMRIDMSLTPEQRNERLRQNIRRMLEKFPPSQPRG